MITDLRDVRFARDPFKLFEALGGSYDLFANTERNNDWMRERFEEVGYPQPALSIILNAGVFGGRAAAVRDVLRQMLGEFREKYSALLAVGRTHISNVDMAVLNHVLLERISRRWRIFTGAPFVGGQAQCELFFDCRFFVYHKWVQAGELPPCKSLSNLDFDALLASNSSSSRQTQWTLL